ncbi:lysosomal alpha-glucosidase-like isoform X2 [Panulirus ornatus]
MFGKRLRQLYVLLLCLLLGLVVPYLLASYAFTGTSSETRGFCGLNVSYRFDCLPSSVPGENHCHSLGCCYDVMIQSDVYAPLCFHSVPSEYGYTIQKTKSSSSSSSSSSSAIRSKPVTYKMGDQQELTLNLTSLRDKTIFNTTAWPLQMKVQRQGDDLLRLLLWSPSNNEYVDDDFQPADAADAQLDVIVEEKEGGEFNITILRVATNETLIETVYGPLIYGEKYIEITSKIPTRDLYGLGQRDNIELSPNFDHRDRWALFSREDVAKTGATYGVHPFLMNFERSGKMYGLYLRNSAPVEVGVLPIPALVFRAVGGALDLRLMAGPSPRDVTRQYTRMVGLPALPPYWALGYHLCRTSSNSSEYESIVQAMEEAKIPYESDCIDARLNYPNSFSELSQEALQRIEDMKDAGRKFLLVQYPFLPVGSDAFNAAQNEQVLMEVSQANETLPYYGSVDGKAVAYPDYLDEDSFLKWLRNDPTITELYSHADGVLLFRNTPLNQAGLNYTAWIDPSGPNCTASTPENCCPRADLPFLPKGLWDLNTGTLCQATQHTSPNGDGLQIPHLEVHNTYGLYHQRRVRQMMEHVRKATRPLLTSQTTHPGSGVLGGYFGGFYPPDFVAQQRGLVQILEAGLYGIPMVGVPICGSVNYTSGELRSEWCLRAHQTAAFWPFMMSHYEYGHAPRNPPDFNKGFSNQLKYFVKQRYMILPYLYTLFYEAHKEGLPVVRPLFYEFPEDPGSRAVSRQFLVGEGLLVSPAFNSIGTDTSVQVQVHFPPGCCLPDDPSTTLKLT